jgi:hypothetical protein
LALSVPSEVPYNATVVPTKFAANHLAFSCSRIFHLHYLLSTSIHY